VGLLEGESAGSSQWQSTAKAWQANRKPKIPGYSSYYGGNLESSASGFAASIGPSGLDAILISNKGVQKRPSSAKYQHKYPLEKENDGYGPADWSVTSRATMKRPATAGDPEVSVSYGNGEGIPQYRIDTGGLTTENKPLASWRRQNRLSMAKQAECPIYSERNTRGKSEDHWATTNSLSYQAPPSTNNYFASRQR